MARHHPPVLTALFLLPTVHSLLLAVLLLITAHCSLLTVAAQSATATLSGTVVDQNGAVVPGAEVKLLNPATAFARQTTASESGAYTLPLLPPGTYSITAQRDGFAPIRVENIVLNVGDQKALQIQLKTGDVTAEVRVISEAPLIDESPAVATVIDRQFVENIPLNGRSFQSLISLMPGVVQTASGDQGEFSVNGQRAESNYFTVDGVSANFRASPTGRFLNGSSPALSATGSTANLVSIDALEEFSIQTSTYAPEFGRSPGAQVSLVSRSGTNAYHGSVYDYIRNDVFDANDWFANANRLAKSPLRQNNFGATLGGPVMLPRFGEGGRAIWSGRNRTFFFFSYEGLRLRLPKTIVTTVPSLDLRNTAPVALRPILNGFPVPNGSDFGNGGAQFAGGYSDTSEIDATSIRVDHTFNQKLTLFGRYNHAPSLASARRNFPAITITESTTDIATVGATLSATPGLINDLRVNYSRDNPRLERVTDDLGGAIVPPAAIFFPPSFSADNTMSLIIVRLGGVNSSVRAGPDFANPVRQINLVDTLTLVRGSHQFKFGLDYRRLAIRMENANLRLLLFSSQADVRNGIVSFLSLSSLRKGFPIYTNFSLFGQDTWRATPRLTLTYGVRWDVNPPPSSADGMLPRTISPFVDPKNIALAPEGTPLYKTTYDNFAPRVGVAYALSRSPGRETMLRGGFGIFYDLGNGAASDSFNAPPFRADVSRARVAFPISAAIDVLPPVGNITPPIILGVVDPNLKLPYVYQWNASVEQALGSSQSLSASYVAAVGRRLTQWRYFINPNPTFLEIGIVTNIATSDYHALQVQFNRRLSRGLQTLASYTWSHSIDDASAERVFLKESRGDSNFDIRHNFSAAVTYDLPVPSNQRIVRALFGGWSLYGTIRAQSAPPIDLSVGTFIDQSGQFFGVRPDVIPGLPFYLDDPTMPGGRRLNNTIDPARPGCKGPFCPVPIINGIPTRQGTLGRNMLRGHPFSQLDIALGRQINLSERFKLQVRAEAFNALNHPNFGPPNTDLTSGQFGVSTAMLNQGLTNSLKGLSSIYNAGGPRSMQFALKLIF